MNEIYFFMLLDITLIFHVIFLLMSLLFLTISPTSCIKKWLWYPHRLWNITGILSVSWKLIFQSWCAAVLKSFISSFLIKFLFKCFFLILLQYLLLQPSFHDFVNSLFTSINLYWFAIFIITTNNLRKNVRVDKSFFFSEEKSSESLTGIEPMTIWRSNTLSYSYPRREQVT